MCEGRRRSRIVRSERVLRGRLRLCCAAGSRRSGRVARRRADSLWGERVGVWCVFWTCRQGRRGRTCRYMCDIWGVVFSIEPSLRMCYARRESCVSSGALRMGNSRLAICVVDDTVYDLLASREWLPLILLLLRLWSSRRHLAYGSGSGSGVVSL